MSARDEIAEVHRTHTIGFTGPLGVTCRGCRERGWTTRVEFHVHVTDAVIAVIRAMSVEDIAWLIKGSTERGFLFDDRAVPVVGVAALERVANATRVVGPWQPAPAEKALQPATPTEVAP
ncbi:hypothetical protein ACPPVT_07585 [Angustibacter sp. McL0619]|uniref:hypothetical protein n=1 Tax=Angustibacter sp. McL0619 TaxID=3415676 RepID=UPI003CF6759D